MAKADAWELVNVHRVYGPDEPLTFLKNASHKLVEGLFYQAKRFGQVTFTIRATTYALIKTRDGSFRVELFSENAAPPPV